MRAALQNTLQQITLCLDINDHMWPGLGLQKQGVGT